MGSWRDLLHVGTTNIKDDEGSFISDGVLDKIHVCWMPQVLCSIRVLSHLAHESHGSYDLWECPSSLFYFGNHYDLTRS